MKKKALTLLATLALMFGGVAAASAHSGNTIYAGWNNTCLVQYKNFNGTIRNLSASQWSVDSVWMVRVPVGCHGSMGIAGQPELILSGGTWKSFTAAAPSGSTVRVWSYKN